MIHGAVTPAVARYTRQITLAWTLFFVAIAAVSTLLFATAPIVTWSTFANYLSLPLVAVMFAAEHACRRLHCRTNRGRAWSMRCARIARRTHRSRHDDHGRRDAPPSPVSTDLCRLTRWFSIRRRTRRSPGATARRHRARIRRRRRARGRRAARRRPRVQRAATVTASRSACARRSLPARSACCRRRTRRKWCASSHRSRRSACTTRPTARSTCHASRTPMPPRRARERCAVRRRRSMRRESWLTCSRPARRRAGAAPQDLGLPGGGARRPTASGCSTAARPR